MHCHPLSSCFYQLVRLFVRHSVYSFILSVSFLSVMRSHSLVVLFLDAPSHLYKRVCPSVRRSVRPSPVIFRRVLGTSYVLYPASFFYIASISLFAYQFDNPSVFVTWFHISPVLLCFPFHNSHYPYVPPFCLTVTSFFSVVKWGKKNSGSVKVVRQDITGQSSASLWAKIQLSDLGKYTMNKKTKQNVQCFFFKVVIKRRSITSLRFGQCGCPEELVPQDYFVMNRGCCCTVQALPCRH